MNIFRILAQGDGAIQEPNVSAFLGYLLNPNEDHGLGSRFLERFLEQHYLICEKDEEIDHSNLEWLYKSGKVTVKTNSNYEVNVFFEQAFKGEEIRLKNEEESNTKKDDEESNTKEIVDIMLVVFETEKTSIESHFKNYIQNKRKLKHVFLIEVKINDSAAQTNSKKNREGQISNQIKNSRTVIENLLKTENSEEKDQNAFNIDSDISLIYVTPDLINNKSDLRELKHAFKEFKELKKKNIKNAKSHMFWNKIRDKEGNIIRFSFKEYNEKYNKVDDKIAEQLKDEDDISLKYLTPIEQILDDIIYPVQEDKLDPIPQFTFDTIKSFSNFIYSDFSYKPKDPPGSGERFVFSYDDFQLFKSKCNYEFSESSWNRIIELRDNILKLDEGLKVEHSKTHPLSYYYNGIKRGQKIFSITKNGDSKNFILHFIFKINYVIDLQNELKKYFPETKCKYKETDWGIIVSNIDNIPNDSIIEIIKVQLKKIQEKYSTK